MIPSIILIAVITKLNFNVIYNLQFLKKTKHKQFKIYKSREEKLL